jgi:hypothetical protein
MLKDKRIQGIILITFLTCSVFAQTNTDSPYSRFGLGQINQAGFDKSRGMGGIGIGLRDNRQLNYLNPASFSAIDTLSFLFDFGVQGTNSTIETSSQTSSYFASNFDHVAIGFPLTKWWKASVGVLPYSKVGYSIVEESYDPAIGFIDYSHGGNGGINQLYLGTAFEFFNAISFGVNFKYLFGSIGLVRSVDFPVPDPGTNYSTPRITNTTLINDFIIELGLQYHKKIGERFELTVGGILDNKTDLSAENRILAQNVFDGNGFVINDSTVFNPSFNFVDTSYFGKINVPARIGAGFSLNYNDRLLLGFDYYVQDWSNALFFGQKEPLTKSNSLRTGLQLTPNPEALKGYHKLISYRLGAHYTNSYLQLNDKQLKNYGISFGAGLPLRAARSSFNFACELGRRGTELNRNATLDNNLVLENYMFFSFSIILQDVWFFKRKFD